MINNEVLNKNRKQTFNQIWQVDLSWLCLVFLQFDRYGPQLSFHWKWYLRAHMNCLLTYHWSIGLSCSWILWRNHSRRTFQFSKLHFPRFHHIQSPILTPSSFLYSWRKRRKEETSIEFRASRKKYLDFTNRRAGKMIFCLIWLKEERREDTKERWRNNKNEESSEGKFIKRCFFAQVPSFSYF